MDKTWKEGAELRNMVVEILLNDMMNTNTGKKIAEKREEFMRAYVDKFMAEWDGKDY